MSGSRPSKHDLRRFAADTTALLSFFTLTGIINERWIAGMSWSEVLNARVLGAVLMVPVARPYGLWRDWLLQRARPDRISQFVWDALALMSFQAPIYAAIIFISGAAGRSLLFGVAGAVVMMLVLGRPYGLYLTWVRNRFGVPPAGGR